MKRCRCCRQSWPLEFFTVCRPDGLRRSTCNACRKGCRPEVRQARHRASALRSWHNRKGVAKVVLRRIVLGPVPCQSCGEAVTWNGYGWENSVGERHRCLARARAWEYNGSAGTSSTQVAFRVDAVPLLVPGGAASSRYEGRD